MFGIEFGVIIQVLSAMTLTSTLVFSATPKGIKSFVALNNWVRKHILNSAVELSVHKVEKRVTFIEGELGVSYTEIQDEPMNH